MGWPTFTTSPSFTSFFNKMPSCGAGTSVSTLSVAISTMGSSAFTASPSFFNHLMMVASATLSPILGSSISMCDIGGLCGANVSVDDVKM